MSDMMHDYNKLQEIRKLTPAVCWIYRVPDVKCTDLIGGVFGNGATFTEEMCCLPCRIKLVIDRE